MSARQARARWQFLCRQMVQILKRVNISRRVSSRSRSHCAWSRSHCSRLRRASALSCAAPGASSAGEGACVSGRAGSFAGVHQAHSVLLAARDCARVPPLIPPPAEGAGRREAPFLNRAFRRDALCARTSRLSALRCGDFGSPGPRFQETPRSSFAFPSAQAPRLDAGRGLRRRPEAACPASSSRRGRSAPRSGPGTSRVHGCEPRPRAPPLAPPSERLRKTPLDEQGGSILWIFS